MPSIERRDCISTIAGVLPGVSPGLRTLTTPDGGQKTIGPANIYRFTRVEPIERVVTGFTLGIFTTVLPVDLDACWGNDLLDTNR